MFIAHLSGEGLSLKKMEVLSTGTAATSTASFEGIRGRVKAQPHERPIIPTLEGGVEEGCEDK